MFGNKVGHLGRVGSLTLAQRVSAMFSRGEPGAWYDPSDMSTLFQDSAGTTPVTAVEQPVGRILDKSGRGNHATQATTTKRPVLSRRVNELLATATLATQSVTTRAAAYRLVFSGAGSVTLSGTASGVYGAGTHSVTCTAGSLTLTVSGTVQDASLTLDTDAHLPYQWVNTATDYDADPSKFPAYLRCDGVDDALQTGNIDFTSTDKMTVWAGSFNTGTTGYHLLSEFGRPASGDVGTFSHFAALDAVGRVVVLSKAGGSEGSMRFAPMPSQPPEIITYALDASKSIPAEAVPIFRKNGLPHIKDFSGTFSTASGFGNYPLYIGARAGTSLYFNGRLYSLIVRGAQTPLSRIEATELYIKQKMRMP